MIRDLAAWCIRIVCGLRVLPETAFAHGPAIYFANHSSHLDFVAIWAALPHSVRQRVRPVAGRDYWTRTPLRQRVAEQFFHALLIERRHVTVATNPVEAMTTAVDAGDSLIVFPEGTRSGDGELHEFKSGLFHLARARPQVPCRPVYLQNLNRILPKGETLPVPLIARIVAGAALHLEPGETKPQFLARARGALLRLAA